MQPDLYSMSIEDLWKLHERVVVRLAAELVAKRKLLEQRLGRLTLRTKTLGESSAFRPTRSSSAKH